MAELIEMPIAFLLRYQEPCVKENLPSILYGTQTFTHVNAEKPDNDFRANDFLTLPPARPTRKQHRTLTQPNTKTTCL